jgi:hypothetical protein
LLSLRASVSLWLKLNLSAVLSGVALAKTEALAKADQSKITNYAKQTQFFKKSNVYNRNFNNELQRKINNGLLVKTNPNEANLIRLWRIQRATGLFLW